MPGKTLVARDLPCCQGIVRQTDQAAGKRIFDWVLELHLFKGERNHCRNGGTTDLEIVGDWHA
jgi:hypothetical protein